MDETQRIEASLTLACSSSLFMSSQSAEDSWSLRTITDEQTLEQLLEALEDCDNFSEFEHRMSSVCAQLSIDYVSSTGFCDQINNYPTNKQKYQRYLLRLGVVICLYFERFDLLEHLDNKVHCCNLDPTFMFFLLEDFFLQIMQVEQLSSLLKKYLQQFTQYTKADFLLAIFANITDCKNLVGFRKVLNQVYSHKEISDVFKDFFSSITNEHIQYPSYRRYILTEKIRAKNIIIFGQAILQTGMADGYLTKLYHAYFLYRMKAECNLEKVVEDFFVDLVANIVPIMTKDCLEKQVKIIINLYQPHLMSAMTKVKDIYNKLLTDHSDNRRASYLTTHVIDYICNHALEQQAKGVMDWLENIKIDEECKAPLDVEESCHSDFSR